MNEEHNNLRHTHIFWDDIEIEPVQELINTINQYDKVDLYFTSGGGTIFVMEALINSLNKHPDLEIYLTYKVCSAATYILNRFKGKIFISKQLEFLMFHAIDRLSYSKRDEGYDRNILNSITDKMNKAYEKEFKSLGGTSKEVKIIREGKNVFWYPKDFKRLTKRFPNITII